MSYFVIDVEADGPVPPLYSMISFGAVLVDKDRKLNKTFYGKTKPISSRFNLDAMAVSATTRKMHLGYDEPQKVMEDFFDWVTDNFSGRAVFMSDNVVFDWAFMNYYFHKFCGRNPFGYSGRRIGDLYCGLHKDPQIKWKHLRQGVHDHHPVNDAKANASILYQLQDLGVDFNF